MKSLETQGKKLREIFFYSLVMEEVFCNTRLVLYRTGMEESLEFNERCIETLTCLSFLHVGGPSQL